LKERRRNKKKEKAVQTAMLSELSALWSVKTLAGREDALLNTVDVRGLAASPVNRDLMLL